RFGSVAMDEERLTAARTVALDPVRARLVERAEDWRWSTAGTLIRRFAPPSPRGRRWFPVNLVSVAPLSSVATPASPASRDEGQGRTPHAEERCEALHLEPWAVVHHRGETVVGIDI